MTGPLNQQFGMSTVWVLALVSCQQWDKCIHLGLWGHGDLTDFEHPFLEFFLAVGSDIQHWARPHGGIRHQGEDMGPTALPFRTLNCKGNKEEG